MWKNFKRSKKDFIVYAGMNLLPASLIFAGVGMAQMLAPFNKEGNILTGHGITAILLEFLIVTLIRFADADDCRVCCRIFEKDEELQYIYQYGYA